VQINLTNFGFLGKISQFFQFQKIGTKKKKKKTVDDEANELHFILACYECSTIFYLFYLHYIFILFDSTPPMLTM
jgi:hypothetical protein